jgi:exosortase/archaeosortase family protein
MNLASQRLRFLAGLLLLLAGLEITITLTYIARWVGLFLMLLGLGILVFTARGKLDDLEESEEEDAEAKRKDAKEPQEKPASLSSLFISIITLKGRLIGLFPLIGAFLILFVYAFNILFRPEFEIGVNDTLTILLGATLMIYNYVPERFERERDFVFIFFISMFMILVLPITIYSLISGPIPESPNSPFIYHLLARPTSDLLNFVGVPSSVHRIPPADSVHGINLTEHGVWIVYKNLGESQTTAWSPVGIGLSCTGLYSVSIFVSGFIAFILLEYRRLDIRVASLLVLGVFTSWFANILRMTIIVIVGSYYGREALDWTHANLGIFIFIVWVGIFWAIMFRLLVPKDQSEERDESNATSSMDDEKEDKAGNHAEKEDL